MSRTWHFNHVEAANSKKREDLDFLGHTNTRHLKTRPS